MAPDLLALIKSAKLATEFGQEAFLSFPLLLRVPPETHLMRRADDSDRISEYPPQKSKVLIGTRRILGSGLLIAKFAWRENMRRGCILRRPCLCGERLILARTLCPAHQVWPLIKERTSGHGFIFPSFPAAKFNKELKRRMQECQFLPGGKYSSHCFRRGATQELQLAEESTDTINRAGCWSGMGFRAYVGDQMTDALKISRLVTRMPNSDSEDEPDNRPGDPRKKNCDFPIQGGCGSNIRLTAGPGPWVFNISDDVRFRGPRKRTMESGYPGGWAPADHSYWPDLGGRANPTRI